MTRRLAVSLLLLFTVIGAALAQQSGPIGSLVGRVGSDGSLAVTGNATDTQHLAAIETAVEAAATGDTKTRKISAGGADDDEFQICAAPCIVTSIHCRNSHATTDAYLKLTNLTAANTTPGSSTVWHDVLIPAGPSGNNATMFLSASVALTGYFATGKLDNDATDVGTGDVSCTVGTR